MGKNACMAPDDQTPDVLTSLPKTRPQRRSAKRDAARASAATPAAAKATPAKAKSKTAPGAKAKPKTAPGAKAEPAAKAATAPRRKPAGKSTALPPSGFASPRKDEPISPSGAELVGTAVQAAGELAQMGAAVGKHALRSALSRLGGR